MAALCPYCSQPGYSKTNRLVRKWPWYWRQVQRGSLCTKLAIPQRLSLTNYRAEKALVGFVNSAKLE